MTLPEGREPLTWADMQFADPAKGHPSTWEAECRALKAQNQELAMQALASEGQASDAYQAQLKLQEELRWQTIRAQQAIDEAKALRAEIERLRGAMTVAINFIGAGAPQTANLVLGQALKEQ